MRQRPLNTDMDQSAIRATAPAPGDIAEILRPLVPSGHGVVLFGSRAGGQARPRSDWDIGVTGEPPVSGAVLERIREALDALPTLHTFEVVDLAAAPPEFRDHALRRAVRLI
jgi:predicted nucleotidyltransferase